MNIYADKLATQLKSKLAAIYIITGDEPLVVTESAELIIKHAKDFQERKIFHVDSTLDLSDVYQSLDNLSLFAEKQIIDLRFKDKPNKAQQMLLTDYCENINPDTLLLLRLPKIEKAMQQSKWFKKIEQHAVVVSVWPIKAAQLPAWISVRAKKLKLSLSPQIIKLIAENTEGNLLAAKQTLEKLSLQGEDINNEAQVRAQLSDNSRYDVFQLSDTLLQGNIKQYAKILKSLEAEGSEVIIVLWSILREINTLLIISSERRQGKSLAEIFKAQRIWPNKQQIINTYFQHNKIQYAYQALQLASQIDKTIKGLAAGKPWQMLLVLGLTLNGIST